jgi:hypothetical protein
MEKGCYQSESNDVKKIEQTLESNVRLTPEAFGRIVCATDAHFVTARGTYVGTKPLFLGGSL